MVLEPASETKNRTNIRDPKVSTELGQLGFVESAKNFGVNVNVSWLTRHIEEVKEWKQIGKNKSEECSTVVERL